MRIAKESENACLAELLEEEAQARCTAKAAQMDDVEAMWNKCNKRWQTNGRVIDARGSTMRLPLRGPVTPMSSPTLLLVTEDHQLNMCYLRAYMPSLKLMKCSITQPNN